MANQFSKKDIDFDVYERANPASQVDWSKQASDITKTFETIRNERQGRKDEIQRLFLERQEQLNQVDIYSNESLQQQAITGSQEAGQRLADFNDLVKRGLATEAQNVLFNHNVKTGFTLFKKNAANFDKVFTEYATRTAGDENAIQEQYIATMLEGFSNLNENKLGTNAETGEVAMMKMEPKLLEDGSINPNAGRPIPNGGMGLQEMTVFMKQRINKFDVGTAANKMSSEVGKYIIADLKTRGIKVEDWEVEYNKMEQELVDNPKGLKILRDKAVQMLTNPQDKMDMLLRNSETKDGTSFKPGTADDYEANGGDSNPNNEIIVFEKDSVGLMQPKFSEAQEEIAITYAEDQILSTLSASRTASVQKIQYTPNATDQTQRANNKFILDFGQNVNKFLTSDRTVETEGAAQALVESMDGLNGLRKTKDGKIIIQKAGKREQVIDVKDLTGDEAMRKIYKAVGGKVSYDAWMSAGGVAGGAVNLSPANAFGGESLIEIPSFKVNYGGEDISSGEYLIGAMNKGDAEFNDGIDATADELENGLNSMFGSEGYQGVQIRAKVIGSNDNLKTTLNINGVDVDLPYVNDVKGFGKLIDAAIKRTINKLNTSKPVKEPTPTPAPK